jgi:threonine dehydrogenase-like Zn-dependent dehydrogenase
VLEAAGREATLAAAVRWLRPVGILALVGIYEDPVQFDPTDLVVKEARVVGVSAYGRDDLVRAASLLEHHQSAASAVISDVLPLARAAEGLEMCRAGTSTGKVLLDCSSPEGRDSWT